MIFKLILVLLQFLIRRKRNVQDYDFIVRAVSRCGEPFGLGYGFCYHSQLRSILMEIPDYGR
jgi:hypothetical protein